MRWTMKRMSGAVAIIGLAMAVQPLGAQVAIPLRSERESARVERDVLRAQREAMRAQRSVMAGLRSLGAQWVLEPPVPPAPMAPIEPMEPMPPMAPLGSLAALDAVMPPAPPSPPAMYEPVASTAPAPWLQEDPGGKLYADAREALNRRQYQRAAETFARIRSDFPRSGYVADSYYWEAFARFRAGGARQLRQANELLVHQGEDHPNASTRRDADALRVRIEAQLARRGDADAAASIAESASGPCNENQEVRLAALSALLNMNADQAVPILQEVLRSRDECSVELRRRAVFLISQKMTDESVDILLDLAHRNPDPDPEVREQAVFWLHQVDTPEALDALESILMESDDQQLQERAIFAISQRSNDRRAMEVLRSYAMRDDIPTDLRANAIFWIGQSSEAGGASYLIELYPRLNDDELRERAIFGISQAGGPEARQWLMERVRDRDESIDIRKNALFWVGQMGGVRAEDLSGLYETLDDQEMKEQVIFVASQSGETESVDFLMDVARNEENGELKQRALFWLGQSNDPRVPEFLLTMIRGVN